MKYDLYDLSSMASIIYEAIDDYFRDYLD